MSGTGLTLVAVALLGGGDGTRKVGAARAFALASGVHARELLPDRVAAEVAADIHDAVRAAGAGIRLEREILGRRA